MHRYTRFSFAIILSIFMTMLIVSGVYVLAQTQLEPYHSLDYLNDYTYMNEETGTMVRIYVDGETRFFETNILPDHEVGQFPNANNPNEISAQDVMLTTPAIPELADDVTEVGLGKFGLSLNGIPFEREAAEWYNRDRNSGWQYDAFGGGIELGFDMNNAHVQPTGLYHYHGVPDVLIAEEDPIEHPLLIGFAGDGFPIYLYYSYTDAEDDSSAIIAMTPSYQLREGTRDSGPGGVFDGTFNEDWEYVEGSGDLDQCNGRFGTTPEFPDGTYYYVLTEAFPRVPTCWSGTVGDGWAGPGGPGDTGQPAGQGEQGNTGTTTEQNNQDDEPDLAAAAQTLGITVQQLQDALGDERPPDLQAAAQTLGITVQQLEDALGIERP